MTRDDAFKTCDSKALQREALLVRQLLGSGATALSRASYGREFGEYYTAFFCLSIGIERLAKLIIVADFAIDNGGSLPDQCVVRKHGHNIKNLIKQIEIISKRRTISVPYRAPTDPICTAVIDCLDAFADASKGRYANFEAIGNPNFNLDDEPVNKWWLEVIKPILETHYRGTQAEASVEKRAALFNSIFGELSTVRFTDERGHMMSDILTTSEHTGRTECAQKYGRLYSLSVVRWLSFIFARLVRDAAGRDLHCLNGLDEHFSTYTLDDKFLLARKVWPLH